MMNMRLARLVVSAGLLLVAFEALATGQQGDRVIVNDADEIRETSVSMTQDLADSMSGVRPRIVLQYANQQRHIGLSTVPGPLQTLLEQVSDRIIVQYANTIRQNGLAPVPGVLQTLLEQVSDRIIFQYANTNREYQLVYPIALINDTTVPQLSEVAVSVTGCDSVTIVWSTDEFADSEIVYGEQSGAYPHTVSDSLYARHHEITLTGLTPGMYYYVVHSTDRSGNTATSSERSFTLACLYLPLAGRNSW